MIISYQGLQEISGSLIALEGVSGVGYEEQAEIRLQDGNTVLQSVILNRFACRVAGGTLQLDAGNVAGIRPAGQQKSDIASAAAEIRHTDAGTERQKVGHEHGIRADFKTGVRLENTDAVVKLFKVVHNK